jgi:hypothetical protein
MIYYTAVNRDLAFRVLVLVHLIIKIKTSCL